MRQSLGLGVFAFTIAVWCVPAARAQVAVLTQRSDNGRNGHVLDSSITPASFADGKWKKLTDIAVEGAIYAQPLYEPSRVMSDGLTHKVIYVATARNKLYAFDAVSYASLWQVA